MRLLAEFAIEITRPHPVMPVVSWQDQIAASEETNSAVEPRLGCTNKPTGRDFVWAVASLAAYRIAVQVLVPLAYLATGNTDLTESHQIGIYFTVNVAELCVLGAIAYFFACRKYGASFAEGLLWNPVPVSALLTSALLAACLVAFDVTFFSRFGEQSPNPLWLVSPPLGAIAVSSEILLQSFAFVVFYQAFAYTALRGLGETGAMFVVTFFFAANSWAGRGPAILMIPPAVLAAALTLQTRKYNSVVPACVTLFLHRLAMVLLLVESLVKGNPVGE